ncbi:MAG: hypothetical protein M1587_04605 [Thaumarchaeota archaeon]|nr:hypothetical protein [Nitrososphaerota archaeon]
MDGSRLSFANIHSVSPAPLPELNNKKNLIDLAKKSLRDEARIVSMDKEYSYASTSWLPVKTYYLLFNMMVTIEYLITLNRDCFRMGHGPCIGHFTRRLETGEIVFDVPDLNMVYDGSIFDYHEPSGTNLRRSLPPSQHTRLVMKKIANYKLDDRKRAKGIPSFRSQANQRKRSAFLQTFKTSIFEFPYYMRIRANYRDFAFIDGVTYSNTADYFNDYLAFSLGFYDALDSLKRQLIGARIP